MGYFKKRRQFREKKYIQLLEEQERHLKENKQKCNDRINEVLYENTPVISKWGGKILENKLYDKLHIDSAIAREYDLERQERRRFIRITLLEIIIIAILILI